MRVFVNNRSNIDVLITPIVSDLDEICKQYESNSNPNSQTLEELRNDINKFFTGSICNRVIFTKNTDSLFFGMRVMPEIYNNDITDALRNINDNKNLNTINRITRYSLELDSRLFELDLTRRELTAILLHEIGHMVNTNDPVEQVYEMINKNSVISDVDLNIDDINNDTNVRAIKIALLRFAICDALIKNTSLFYKDKDEIDADRFVELCGYGNDLKEALKKISKKSFALNKNVNNKAIVLSWVFKIYKNINLRRIPAIKTIMKCRNFTGSKLEKEQLEILEKNLNKKGMVSESLGSKNIFTKLKGDFLYKTIRDIRSDMYEYNMRYRNIDNESDAILLLREINNRINILDDALQTEGLDEHTKKLTFDLIDELDDLRDRISKKIVYKSSELPAIIVNYPDIKG